MEPRHQFRLPRGPGASDVASRSTAGILVVVDEKSDSMKVARLEQIAEPHVVVPPAAASAARAGGGGRRDDDDWCEVNPSRQGGRREDLVDESLLGLPLDEDDDPLHEVGPSCVGRPPSRFISHRLPVE